MDEKTDISDEYQKSEKPKGMLHLIADMFDISKTLVLTLSWIALIVIPLVTVAFYSWTYRGHLEEEARKGVIVTPLEYKKTMISFPKLGYKLVLERITNEQNFTLAEMVYKQRMLEQQMLAHKNSVFLETQAVAKKKQQVLMVQNYEQQERNEKLIQEVGKSLDISPEDQDDLKSIILGEN